MDHGRGEILLGTTETGKRCLRYVDARAEELAIAYDLSESHLNKALLCTLWDACLSFDAKNESYTPEMIQAICDSLLDASKVNLLQGVRHREPESLEDYERLFNTPMVGLNLIDTPYVPPEGVDMNISWSVTADNDEVLKLTPGVQLTIPFVEVAEA